MEEIKLAMVFSNPKINYANEKFTDCEFQPKNSSFKGSYILKN